MSDNLFSLVARHNVERIYNNGQDRPGQTVSHPFVLEEEEPEPLSFLLARETAIPEPLIGDGLLYPGTVMVIGGASKARKSWLAIDLSLSLVSGGKFLIHPVPNRLRVLYLGAEGMEWKIKRDFQQAAIFKPGITDDDLDRLWVKATLGRIKIDTDAGEKWLDKWAGLFHVVIIDPYYRFLSLGKENDHSDQRKIQDVIDRLKAQGKAVVLCHHLRKPQGEDHGAAELRGAGLDQFADSILILKRKRTPTSDQTTLHYTLRNAPEPDVLNLSVSDATGPLLIPGEDRKVSVADVVKVLKDAGGRIEGREALMESLRRATGCGETKGKAAIIEAEKRERIWSAKNPQDRRGRIYILKDGVDE
jgi:hypothetical protein